MPDLTAERFIHHSEYGKIYRTGDFGRLLPDGSIYFIGRRDDQIKLRGQRIELGEINSVLLSNEVVKDCTSVVLETGNQNQEQLVAFWVPSYELNDRSPGLVAHDLFEKLRDVLPGYMIPSHIVPVDTLPMTENGKADHKGLLQRFQQMSYDELLALSPEPQTADSNEDLSELETSMAAILSDVTGTRLSDIRRNTSFYHVGLDSISAISFSRKLRDGGFGQLDVSTILRQSSVARLSAVILTRNEKRSHDSSANDRLENLFDDNFIQQTKGEFERAGRTVQAIYPCTPLQEAMLSVGVSQSQSAYFNHLLFESYVDFNDLRDVWGQILKRHAIFKTCFKATNNAQFAYAQVVLENIPLPLHYVDVSMGQLDLYIEEQKLQFQKRFQAGGVLPYALTVFWDRIGRKTFLLLSIHHALHDGEAMTLLFQEIQSLLSHQPIPEVIPFESFIRNMISTDINAADGYWNRYLSGVLPSLLAGSKSDESANAAFQSQIDLGTPYDLLKEKCKEISVTPLNVFHTAWARLLSFYLDSPDVCFGNVFSCRTIPLEGADRIVGPCFNTLPIRVNFSSTATNEDIMKLNRRSNSDMLLHQLSSLRRIQRRALGDGSQLFDTLLILQTRPLDLDENLWKLVSEEGNMDFPFICEIIPDEKQNNVHVSLHSRESCISPADGELIVRQFAALVDHILRYPSGQTSDRRPIGNAIPFLPKKVSGRSRKFESLAPVPPQISHQPWSHPEEVVRDALCEFAKIESGRISRETTIFQLGLDSINAVQVAGYLRDLGYGVSAGNILEAASISNISNLLDSSGQVTKGSSFDLPSFEARYLRSTCQQLQISEKTVECLRPCTPVQNGMLAMFSNSNGDIYFNRMALMPSEPLDTPLLKEAWRKAMAKHEMLRTGFVQLQDQRHPFAMITYRKEATDLPWFEVLDPVQGTMPPQGVESVLKNLHLPPWYLVAQRSDSTTILQLSALHAIYDAQSLHLILADVVAACRGESLGDGAPINTTLEPILTESFLKNDEAERFWKGESMDIQPSKFPDLHPFRTEQKELLVNSILCSKSRKVLEDGCQKIGMTLQAAGQAAWARLLSAYTGESSVVFGVVSSGRNLSTAAQDAVFPCLVTMPSPCRVASTNRELLGSILQRNASMIKYQFTPLSKIQHWLRADEGLFDTLFVYQKFSSQKEAAETWRIVAEDTRIDVRTSSPCRHANNINSDANSFPVSGVN